MKGMPGLVQWFPFDDRDHVSEAVELLRELRVTELRTLFSWADWEREDGSAWFDWFTGMLSQVEGLRLLPSLFYTPPALARPDAEGKTATSYPPKEPETYAVFVRTMIERYGAHFDWIQLWNEPNWKPYWDWEMDPQGELFAQMAIPAAQVSHELGKKVVLGGTTPLDYPWFARMEETGLLKEMDAVSFHYSPSWDNQHRRWFPLHTEIAGLRALLSGFGRNPEVWLDESGISTCTKNDQDAETLERKQIEFFEEIRVLPVERAYWFSLFDQPEDTPTDDELNAGTERDPTAYHFGMVTNDGKKKALFEHWKALADTERTFR
jgi:CDP-paratose 2-epimerase